MWVTITSMEWRLRTDRRATTAVEYALLGALVAGGAMAGMIAMGITLETLFSSMSGHVTASTPAIP